jgi:energy-coupling factor transporter ATP-binding protein EcfA2
MVSSWEPNCVTFHGPDGCGKTTIAESLAKTISENTELSTFKLGAGADTEWLRRFQTIINDRLGDYHPIELVDWQQRQDLELQEQGRRLAVDIERNMKKTILSNLKILFGENWDLEIGSIKRDCILRAEEEKEKNYKEALARMRGAEEEAHQQGEKKGEVRGQLNARLEMLELNESMAEFAQAIIDRTVELTDEDSGEIFAAIYTINNWSKDAPTKEEYKERQDIVFELFGVKKDEAQPWMGGFGINYIHSRVYDTIFPGIIVRECYDRGELQSDKDGSRLTIEKNSRFQK